MNQFWGGPSSTSGCQVPSINSRTLPKSQAFWGGVAPRKKEKKKNALVSFPCPFDPPPRQIHAGQQIPKLRRLRAVCFPKRSGHPTCFIGHRPAKRASQRLPSFVWPGFPSSMSLLNWMDKVLQHLSCTMGMKPALRNHSHKPDLSCNGNEPEHLLVDGIHTLVILAGSAPEGRLANMAQGFWAPKPAAD